MHISVFYRSARYSQWQNLIQIPCPITLTTIFNGGGAFRCVSKYVIVNTRFPELWVFEGIFFSVHSVPCFSFNFLTTSVPNICPGKSRYLSTRNKNYRIKRAHRCTQHTHTPQHTWRARSIHSPRIKCALSSAEMDRVSWKSKVLLAKKFLVNLKYSGIIEF